MKPYPNPRPDPRRPEPLLRRPEVIATLNISPRTFERMLASGEFPRPDLRIGRLTLWRPGTVHDWINARMDQQKRGAA